MYPYPDSHGARIAPASVDMLQASYMRKWMSDRLKRRKKPGDGENKEATKAPEPLQPKYYDNDPAAEAPAEAPVVESRRQPREISESAAKPEAEIASGPEAVTSASGSAAGDARPRAPRRRRGRGGRSGSRP